VRLAALMWNRPHPRNQASLRWAVGTNRQAVQGSSGNRRNPPQWHVGLLTTEIGVGFCQSLHGTVGHGLIRELVIETELALDVPAPAEDLALRHEGQTVAATGLQYSGRVLSH
jgi:hypothetical protein